MKTDIIVSDVCTQTFLYNGLPVVILADPRQSVFRHIESTVLTFMVGRDCKQFTLDMPVGNCHDLCESVCLHSLHSV